MSALLDLLMPLKTVSALNAREFWAAKARRVKHERRVTATALLTGPGWRMQQKLRRLLSADGRLVVLLERHSKGTLDDDNLRGALKGPRDEIAQWLGVDDRDPRVRWAYTQAKAKGFALRVTITEEGTDA